MAKRRKKPPEAAKGPLPDTPAARLPGWVLLRAGVLVVTLVLIVVGGMRVRALWQRLPGSTLELLEWDDVRDARRSLSGTARDAYIAVVLSDYFTTAMHEPERLPRLLDDARQFVPAMRTTNLGRLQLAALTLKHIDRAGVPESEWWTRIRPYVEGLGAAELGHHVAELVEADARAMREQGIDWGTARRVAAHNAGNAHGPFLQYIVDTLRRVAVARHEAGDDEAARECERVVRHLLASWVREEAPAGLRLLAARLLADVVESPLAGEPSTEDAALARTLREWRREFRERALDLPRIPSTLRITDDPVAPISSSYGDWLAWSIATVIWDIAVLGGMLVIVLVAGAAWVRQGGNIRVQSRYIIAVVVLVTVIGQGSIRMAPETVHHDILCVDDMGRDADTREDLGWPVLPLYAVLTGLCVVPVVVLFAYMLGRRESAVPFAGGTAVLAAFMLSLLLLLAVRGAETNRVGYETMNARSFGTELGEIADPGESGVLDALRGWTP